MIGDTIKDVAAARTIGAECVAVATGGSTVDELRAVSPTHLFDDLEQPGAITAVLGD